MVASPMRELSPSHKQRLAWFEERSGMITGWPSPLREGIHLASKAKGIFKPADLEFAVSIRVSFNGPYSDGEVEYRGDDSWSLRYSQEEPDGYDPSTYWTNLSLQRCIEARIPVGVFIRLDEPNSRSNKYQIVGLALPVSWSNGFFTFEGPISLPSFASTGAIGPGDKYEDDRKRVLREIAARQGQPIFRRLLIDSYQSRCVLSDCTTVEALEAAHIRPYRGPLSNTPKNGILLRADLHTLFDLHLFGVEPVQRTVELSPRLRNSQYAKLQGRQLVEPRVLSTRPSDSILFAAWADFKGAAS